MPTATSPIRFGVFEVDVRSGELRKNGIRIHLADQPLHVLALLLEHPGELVTREELRQRLWLADTFVDFENGLNAAVKRLREALGDSATHPRYIETAPRHGYRFVGPAVETRGPSLVKLPDPTDGQKLDAHANSHRRLVWTVATAALLLMTLSLAIYRMRHQELSAFDDRTIAVLPFEDMSPGKDQEYFADGLADELLTDLAKIPELRVSARTSSFQFRNKGEDLRSIAKKLNVHSILEGGVRKSGNRVRITVQLIDAVGGFHLWSESYDRELVDIFAVQAEIAHAVAEALKVSLLQSKPAPQSMAAQDAEAYNAYLQGRYFSERRNREDVQKGIQYYEQSLELNPNSARTWASLAEAHMHLADSSYIPVEVGYGKAREETERALALDPNLAKAHQCMGWIKMAHDWNWEAAHVSYQRALFLEPSNATTVWQTARLALTVGQVDDALKLVRKSVELDPLDTTAYLNLGDINYYKGHQDEAAAALSKAIELNPEFPVARAYLARVYLLQGRPQDALAVAEKEPDAGWRLYALVLASYAAGNKKQSDDLFADFLQKYPTEWYYQIAQMYAYRGDLDHAFEWLERGYAEREVGLCQIKGDPLFRNLERDPRYAAFVKKMAL